MDIDKMFRRARKDKKIREDLHVLRFYSSFITVSRGKVIGVTRPSLRHCPLAEAFYAEINNPKEEISNRLKKVIQEKISKFGFFTGKRKFFKERIAVPYGASEILTGAMKKKIIDAAVIVCDGAGTVIVNDPKMVQGIGARMNGIFFTSPIKEIKRKLTESGCEIPFEDAAIDQVKGVEIAAKRGYKNIAVTISALMSENLKELKKIQKKHGVKVAVLTICTTGTTEKKIREIGKYSDLVWSCASEKTRKIIGKKALLQLSVRIPVFALTRQGLDVLGGYIHGSGVFKKFQPKRQYLIDSSIAGEKISLGCFNAYLSEGKLPARIGKQRKNEKKTGTAAPKKRKRKAL